MGISTTQAITLYKVFNCYKITIAQQVIKTFSMVVYTN